LVSEAGTVPGTPGGPITTLVPSNSASCLANSSMAPASSSSVTSRDQGWTPLARTESGAFTSGANSASTRAATAMISAGVR
jgi:hypothetical protein